MRLEWVKCFIWAARYGSVNRAAEELFMTQPTVSKQIKKLEGFLEVELFKRTASGVRLTREGAHFKLYAEKMLEAYDKYISEKSSADFVLNTLDKDITFVVTPLLLQSYYEDLESTLKIELGDFNFKFMEAYLPEIQTLVSEKSQTYGLAYCPEDRAVDGDKVQYSVIEKSLIVTCAHRNIFSDKNKARYIISSQEYFDSYFNEEAIPASLFSSNLDLILKKLNSDPNMSVALPRNIAERSKINEMNDIQLIYNDDDPFLDLQFIYKEESADERLLIKILEDILRGIFKGDYVRN
ncbi:MAG: LysR family transcriptional regulator [Clostridiales bacterium]|nr:LysR family transcriptional regulator [Clostridiales bacterium]